MNYSYLIALIVSLGCLGLVDYRYRLVFFSPLRTFVALPIGLSMIFFLIWDITGLMNDVFATNQSWVTGVHLFTPNLPLEEFFFLALLSYVTVLFWELTCKRIS